MVGSIIIIIILIAGGIYIWQSKVKDALEKEPQTETIPTEEDTNELNSLEQDIDETNIEIEGNAIESVQ